MDRKLVASLLVVAASAAFSAYAYASLPQTIATHWNFEGEADGFSGREAVFLMPIITLGVVLLLWLLPSLDPLKENVRKFRKDYDAFVLFMAAFLTYISVVTTASNLGWVSSPAPLFAPAIGAMLYAIGVFLPKTRRSWFIGIRTPWTMSSDGIWKETHRIGGIMFKAAGIACVVLGIIYPTMTFAIIGALAAGSAISLIIYSYALWRKEKK